MKSYFYIVINNINGKRYYGSGSKKNYIGSGVALQNAIKKYGKENFTITILREFESRKDAFSFEDRFLKLFKISSLPNTYNLKDSAEGGDTWSHLSMNESYLRKDAIRNKLKGLVRSDEHRNNISKGRLGIKIKNTENMSISKIGDKNPMYNNGHKIAGEKNGQYGKICDMSPNWGKRHKPETIELMKQKARRGPRSEEEKKRMSDGIKKNMKYFIRQLNRKTGEFIKDYLTCKDASVETGIKYHKIYSNTDENFEFIRVYKQ